MLSTPKAVAIFATTFQLFTALFTYSCFTLILLLNIKRQAGKRKALTLRRALIFGCVVLSVSSSADAVDWVYRIFDHRMMSVKAKNETVQKVAAIDLLTNLPFSADVVSDEVMRKLETDKVYYASLKVFTAQNVSSVAPEFVEFFTILDVDQSIEDFIKAYWLYPKLIRFELADAEPT
jgi:hypothetical protein